MTGEEGARQVFLGDQMFISIPTTSPSGARVGGCTEVAERQRGEPFLGSYGRGTEPPPTECFLSAEGLWGHSQASFPSKLERAMAKACRAHSGYR